MVISREESERVAARGIRAAPSPCIYFGIFSLNEKQDMHFRHLSDTGRSKPNASYIIKPPSQFRLRAQRDALPAIVALQKSVLIDIARRTLDSKPANLMADPKKNRRRRLDKLYGNARLSAAHSGGCQAPVFILEHHPHARTASPGSCLGELAPEKPYLLDVLERHDGYVPEARAPAECARLIHDACHGG